MMQQEALNRLDEIEQLAPDPTVDAGALAIMRHLAQTPGGLRLLVDRYSISPSLNIIGYLSFVLAEHAEKATSESALLIFDFVERLRQDNYSEALISSLTAIQRQIHSGTAWGNSSKPPPPSLYAFLQHCLNFSGRLYILVQSGAIELLTQLCEKQLLNVAFKPDQIKWVKERVNQLSKANNELLGESIAELHQCLDEDKNW